MIRAASVWLVLMQLGTPAAMRAGGAVPGSLEEETLDPEAKAKSAEAPAEKAPAASKAPPPPARSKAPAAADAGAGLPARLEGKAPDPLDPKDPDAAAQAKIDPVLGSKGEPTFIHPEDALKDDEDKAPSATATRKKAKRKADHTEKADAEAARAAHAGKSAKSPATADAKAVTEKAPTFINPEDALRDDESEDPSGSGRPGQRKRPPAWGREGRSRSADRAPPSSRAPPGGGNGENGGHLRDSRWFVAGSTDEELDLLLLAAADRTADGAESTEAAAAGQSDMTNGQTGERQDRVSIYLGELVCAVMLMVSFMQYQRGETEQTLEHMFATYSCSLYLLGSVLIDLSIKNSPMYFDPASLVFLVEFGKLIFSTVLWFATRDVNGKVLSTEDIPAFMASAACFTAYNIVVFFSIQLNDVGAFAIFRETAIIWTALAWSFVFKMNIGQRRWLAIFGIFAGLVINQLSLVRHHQSFNYAILLVVVGTLLNAGGSVTNEFAMKRCAEVDINLQNMLLYSLTSLASFSLFIMLHPETVTRPNRFFDGFDKSVPTIVLLQLFQGLAVARIIKYANTMVKNAVAALRGPVLLLVSLHMGFAVRFDFFVALSAVVGGASACWFLTLGRPKKGD